MVGGMLDVGLGTMVSRLSLDVRCCFSGKVPPAECPKGRYGTCGVVCLWFLLGVSVPPTGVYSGVVVCRQKSRNGRKRSKQHENERDLTMHIPARFGLVSKHAQVSCAPPNDKPSSQARGAEREVCAMAAS